MVFAEWPAVPFASLVTGDRNGNGNGNGNGTPRSRAVGLPHSQSQSSRSSAASVPLVVETETQVRKRELAEEQVLYPPLRSPRPLDPPATVIPLSPDPFSRYPSSISRAPDSTVPPVPSMPTAHRNSNSNSMGPVKTPEVEPPIPLPGIEQQQLDTHSSRFSADSITGDDVTTKNSNRTTLINVKSIRKLWRRSNKSSISVSRVPQSPDTHTNTNSTSASSVTSFPTSSSSISMSSSSFSSLSSIPPESWAQSQFPQRKSAQQPQQAQQEPSNFHSNSNPARRSPIESGDNKDKGIRKSILKPWKSSSGLSSQSPQSSQSSQSSQHANPGSEPRMSGERYVPPGPGRARRPSVLSFASGRGSVSSADIPPSPQIPQQFANGLPNGTNGPNGMGVGEHRQYLVKSRMSDAGSLPPRSQSVASSRASGDTRPSIDMSQFEIVSPKANQGLSYPLHGLDHE